MVRRMRNFLVDLVWSAALALADERSSALAPAPAEGDTAARPSKKRKGSAGRCAKGPEHKFLRDLASCTIVKQASQANKNIFLSHMNLVTVAFSAAASSGWSVEPDQEKNVVASIVLGRLLPSLQGSTVEKAQGTARACIQYAKDVLSRFVSVDLIVFAWMVIQGKTLMVRDMTDAAHASSSAAAASPAPSPARCDFNHATAHARFFVLKKAFEDAPTWKTFLPSLLSKANYAFFADTMSGMHKQTFLADLLRERERADREAGRAARERTLDLDESNYKGGVPPVGSLTCLTRRLYDTSGLICEGEGTVYWWRGGGAPGVAV